MDSPSRAEQACSGCRKLKRKCDKSLPQCSLCERTGRRCDYATPSSAASSSDLAAVYARIAELDQRLASTPTIKASQLSESGGKSPGLSLPTHSGARESSVSVQFPTALFLDIDCYKYARMRLPQHSIDIPTNVLYLLTQGNTIVETAEEFFNTIHIWMPVISKKRLNLGIAVHHGGPDIAMLFLAMRLIISPPGEEAEFLYELSKNFLATLESAGVVSYLCLQALLLVALYEYSQAIYPAAWVRVGVCTRYVELLGISCSASRNIEIRQSTTWTEIEERRRLWWGVFILDRIICIGNRRHFCLQGPLDDGLLPVDDQAWDEGDVTRIKARPISAEPDPDSSPFAHLCQAALLVDEAVKTTWRAPLDSTCIAKCSALIDRMSWFMSVVDAGGSKNDQRDLSWISSRAVSRSALYLVLDLFSCPEKMTGQPGYVIGSGAKSCEELDLQQRSMSLTIELAGQMHILAAQLLVRIETEGSSHSHLSQISPFILDVLYCSLATYYWFAGERGDEGYEPMIRALKMFLERIGTRWRLGHEYLKLIKYHDSNTRSNLLSEF